VHPPVAGSRERLRYSPVKGWDLCSLPHQPDQKEGKVHDNAPFPSFQNQSPASGDGPRPPIKSGVCKTITYVWAQRDGGQGGRRERAPEVTRIGSMGNGLLGWSKLERITWPALRHPWANDSIRGGTLLWSCEPLARVYSRVRCERLAVDGCVMSRSERSDERIRVLVSGKWYAHVQVYGRRAYQVTIAKRDYMERMLCASTALGMR
jgi:hypothetical protein